MSINKGDNTNLRLKAVLETLADQARSGESAGAGAVLAEAIARVPLDERESELLSGGVPRGHKSLTTATAKLVKAGWMVKGRGGWTITEEGQRAAGAFSDPDIFAAALANGTPVPADVPAAAPSSAPTKQPARNTRPGKATAKTAAGAAEPRTSVAEPNAAAAVEPGTSVAEPNAAAAVVEPDAVVEPADQPDAVAIVGDFNTLLGAPEDWAPQYDEAQMGWDPQERLWKLNAELPAGFYIYKAAINRSWDENYGAYGVRSGANHELHHAGGSITFRYNHRTGDVSTS